MLRMILQSAVLGLGAMDDDQRESCRRVQSSPLRLPPHARLRPWISQLATGKGFVAARTAFNRLKETVIALSGAVAPMALPAHLPTR